MHDRAREPGPPPRVGARARRASAHVSAILLAGAGCTSPTTPRVRPDNPTMGASWPEEQVQRGEATVTERPEDLGARFALGVAYEQVGKLESASKQYEFVIRKIPPRQFTGPMLRYAQVELKLRHEPVAQRAFEEILATVPADTHFYQENPDYRIAAIHLAPILERQGQTDAFARLRRRFVVQLAGEPEEWPLRGR